MATLREWVTRFWGTLRPRRPDAELEEELRLHLELAAEAERRRDTSTEDARRTAAIRSGGMAPAMEALRDQRGLPWLHDLGRDLHYALRALRRSPMFALVVVLTLGLGIGANTAFFSVINAALIRPLGYADADRLVSVLEAWPQRRVDRIPFSALDFEDFRSGQESFETVAAYRNVPFELSGGGTPERIEGAKVSADLFRTLGVGPRVGRSFSTAEDRPGVNVAVLSWGLWQRRFAADSAIVGRTIQLDRQPYTVIGIMPASFVFPRRGPQFNNQPADVWVPIAFTARERAERASMHTNSVVGRLKDGVSLQTARTELDLLAGRIADNYPPALRDSGFSPRLAAEPLREAVSGRFEAPLMMLLAAVGLVLLVACANVANLILGRVAGRTREFAVRTALGARQSRLVQLLLCEASLLSVAGGLAGITVAYWTVKAVPTVIAKTVPGLEDVTIDFRVLAFTVVVCLATTVLFAVLPLATLERGSPGDSLRDDTSRTSLAPRKLRVQRGLVVSTVGLTFVLLVGAGLFIRSFAMLMSTDIGFRPEQVVTASMTLPRTFYTTASSVRGFHESLYRHLSVLPGVQSVALATDLPLTTYELRAFTPEGANIPEGAQPTTHLTWVHGPYFETLGMALREGRFFIDDEHLRNRSVVVVNEKLADLSWPGQDPVGKRLKWGIAGSRAPWLTVVGVVRNVADGPIGAEPGIHAYEPFQQLPDFFLDGAANQFGRDVKAAVLAQGEPGALGALIRQEISTLDPELAIQNVELMDEQIRDVVAPQRLSTLLVGAFAAMALLLASVGLYGLLAFTTAQRRREIAVRMALGAERHTVIRMVIGQGARLAVIGVIAGFIGSLALTRVVASLLYQTDPYDLVTFATVPALLTAVVLMACALPAWRAARVDPMTALRAE